MDQSDHSSNSSDTDDRAQDPDYSDNSDNSDMSWDGTPNDNINDTSSSSDPSIVMIPSPLGVHVAVTALACMRQRFAMEQMRQVEEQEEDEKQEKQEKQQVGEYRADGKYELKPELYDEVDPSWPDYSPKEQQRVDQNLQDRQAKRASSQKRVKKGKGVTTLPKWPQSTRSSGVSSSSGTAFPSQQQLSQSVSSTSGGGPSPSYPSMTSSTSSAVATGSSGSTSSSSSSSSWADQYTSNPSSSAAFAAIPTPSSKIDASREALALGSGPIENDEIVYEVPACAYAIDDDDGRAIPPDPHLFTLAEIWANKTDETIHPLRMPSDFVESYEGEENDICYPHEKILKENRLLLAKRKYPYAAIWEESDQYGQIYDAMTPEFEALEIALKKKHLILDEAKQDYFKLQDRRRTDLVSEMWEKHKPNFEKHFDDFQVGYRKYLGLKAEREVLLERIDAWEDYYTSLIVKYEEIYGHPPEYDNGTDDEDEKGGKQQNQPANQQNQPVNQQNRPVNQQNQYVDHQNQYVGNADAGGSAARSGGDQHLV